MIKTVLITGASDGIGLETAKALVNQGHHVILHGRNEAKLKQVEQSLLAEANAPIETIVADLSSLRAVRDLATEIAERFGKLDVLINNAGVYTVAQTRTEDDLDVRFAVNTIAPFYLTKALLPLFDASGRVVNLSSAAQSSIDIDALEGKNMLSDGEAYAQSKLALTMWSRDLGIKLKDTGPMVVSVNPKSFLGSKMVKDAYGMQGGDLQLGADILVRAALSDEFSHAHGAYYDNDNEMFTEPHPEALDPNKTALVIRKMEDILKRANA
ncbi:MAG: SDR family NAD(P)-dependent oxidoreductase [Vibrio sp.]